MRKNVEFALHVAVHTSEYSQEMTSVTEKKSQEEDPAV